MKIETFICPMCNEEAERVVIVDVAYGWYCVCGFREQVSLEEIKNNKLDL